MQHPHKAILRLTQNQSVTLANLRRYSFGVNAPRIVASQPIDMAIMGKDKVQFLLKTPKGTKDCEYPTPHRNGLAIEFEKQQGKGKTWSSVTEYSPP